MKKLCYLATAATFFLAVIHPSHARDLETIQKTKTIKIAVDGMTPPFNYYKGKDLVGFEIDLAQEIAKRVGAGKVEWVVQPFNTLLVALGQDRFDLIATSHAITEQRKQVVDFADPHYCTGTVLVSKPGGPKNAKQLVGKTVVVPVGTVYHEQLKKIPGIAEIRTVPNETDGLQNLLAGRADAWATEQFVALEAVGKHKDAKLGVGEVLQPQENAMVVAKGNDGLRTAVNGALKELLKNGTYAKLSKKYFERDIRCK